MTANRDGADDPPAQARAELLGALEREGIAYPPERLDEAVSEYVQLKALMAVVNGAACASVASPSR